jgi:hypothetical protein
MNKDSEAEACMNGLMKLRWILPPKGSAILPFDQYQKGLDYISRLRRLKHFEPEEIHTMRNILRVGYQMYKDHKEWERQHPRRVAQAFIGKKNIRLFILNRDGFKCLRCDSYYHLTIDHIVPIHYGGENKISNLQTLCRSCNSWKSTKTIDFREGARYGN